MLKATWVSKMFFGNCWNESRFTVCSCNLSMPFWPCSEAGSNTVATARFTCPAFCTRNKSRASTTAAGCATTAGPGCNSGIKACPSCRSIHGERIAASGSSSRAEERSTMALPALRAVFQFLRVDSGSEAKKVKSIFWNCSVRTFWMNVTSPATASSFPSDSSSSNNLTSIDGKLRSLSTSATSLPLSVPAPTMARR